MKHVYLLLYRIVAFLLCAVLLTFSMISAKFARYSTGDNSGNWADVASFNVSTTYGAVIDNGLTKEYPVTISNDSEVRVGFSKVTVTFHEALPDDITLVLTDEEGNELCAQQQTDAQTKEFVFPYSTELSMHTNKVIHLRITQANGAVFDAAIHTAQLTVAVYQVK